MSLPHQSAKGHWCLILTSPVYQGTVVSASSHNWALLYRDTFKLVFFVKVSKHAGNFCDSIRAKYRLQEHRPLVFCKWLQNHCIRHAIVFHVPCSGTVIICRKQVDDTPILLSRHFKIPACFDTFTKSTGVKVLRYKNVQLWSYVPSPVRCWCCCLLASPVVVGVAVS